MPDLKQISHEIAQAIFDSIEQDRMLILSRIADVIHKELAVRLPVQKEPDPVQSEERRGKAEKWRQIKEFMEMFPPAPVESNPWLSDNWIKNTYLKRAENKSFRELYLEGKWDGYTSTAKDEEKQTATAVRERQQKEEIEARLAAAERTINPPVIEGSKPELDRPLPEPRWIAWDFAAKKREIT